MPFQPPVARDLPAEDPSWAASDPQITDKPMIYVCTGDLAPLRAAVERSDTPGARLLRQELSRAIQVEPDEAPRRFIRLGARVEFVDLLDGRTAVRRLTLPTDEAPDALPVTSILGAALIGLCTGDSFGWSGDGKPHVFVVLNVTADAPAGAVRA